MRKIYSIILLTTSVILLSSCGGFDKYYDSGFASRLEPTGYDKPNPYFPAKVGNEWHLESRIKGDSVKYMAIRVGEKETIKLNVGQRLQDVKAYKIEIKHSKKDNWTSDNQYLVEFKKASAILKIEDNRIQAIEQYIPRDFNDNPTELFFKWKTFQPSSDIGEHSKEDVYAMYMKSYSDEEISRETFQGSRIVRTDHPEVVTNVYYVKDLGMVRYSTVKRLQTLDEKSYDIIGLTEYELIDRRLN